MWVPALQVLQIVVGVAGAKTKLKSLVSLESELVFINPRFRFTDPVRIDLRYFADAEPDFMEMNLMLC